MRESFIATPQLSSLYDLLKEHGRYYCIPEYQRQFSWEKRDIKRLLEDTTEGLTQLTTSDDRNEISRSARFLGAFICCKEEGGGTTSSVVPGKNGNPNNIWSVIDGQQRLTVLTLLCAEIHNQLRVQKYNTKIGEGWLRKWIEGSVQTLGRVLGEPRNEGEVFYPRIIRAHGDKWGEQDEDKWGEHDKYKAEYTSDLAAFLTNYRKAIDEGSKKLFESPVKFKEKSFKTAMDYIRKELKNIEGNKDLAMPLLEDLFKPEVVKAMFDRDEPEHKAKQDNVKKEYILWKSAGNGSNEEEELVTLNSIRENNEEDSKEVRQALLLLFFVRYIYEKMLFVEIVAQDSQGHALNIFESLNTTGLLLTAFETFKPEVIRRLGRKASESSSASKPKSKGYLRSIEKLLGSKAVTSTKELIISFALAESGEAMTSSLAEQRDYLRGRYSKLKDDDEAEKFVRRLLDVTIIQQNFLSKKANLDTLYSGENPEVARHLEEASFCLHYLSAAKHRIVKALIARFYSFHEIGEMNEADEKEREAKIIDLCEVIKATAAFFTLWMATRDSTSNIDWLHRKIMSGIQGMLLGYSYTNQAAFNKVGDEELRQMYRAEFEKIYEEELEELYRRKELSEKYGKELKELSSIEFEEVLDHSKDLQGIYSKELKEIYSKELEQIYSSKRLKEIYRSFLSQENAHSEGVISGRADWIAKSSIVESYEGHKARSKFILMTANHGTMQHPEERKRLERGIDGASPMQTVRKDSWKEAQYESIEHIYPQKPRQEDGDKELQPEFIHRIGNLTLLPKLDNQKLSNMAWHKKKLICTVLAATVPSVREKAIEALEESTEFEAEQIAKFRKKLSKGQRCLPLTATLIHYKKFDEEDIKKRGEHLLGLAWDILAVEWLGWENKEN